MINIICVGKIKEKYFSDAINEYVNRLKKYTKIQITEIPDEGLVEEQKAIKIEGEKILNHLSGKEYIITLEINGKQFTSVEFAKKLDKIQISNNNITFIIGGSYGLSEEVKTRTNLHLSFSNMTFPHQLFRIILLEQIYRAYKINNNEKYHK